MNEEIINKFDNRIKAVEPHIVAILAEIDNIKGEFKGGLRMSPQAIVTLKKSVIVTSAGASTRIEGSKLSDDEVKTIFNNLNINNNSNNDLNIKQFTDRDSQEVQGYLEVLQNVFNAYSTLILREGTILSLHGELMKYSSKDLIHRGQYKKQENFVGTLNDKGEVDKIIFQTTPAWLTEKEVKEILEYSYEALEKKRFHSLLIIANFIIEFLKIHPFQDGNGRLSRVLTNLLLLQSGYQFTQYVSHEQIIESRKDEYYFALRSSQATFIDNSKNIYKVNDVGNKSNLNIIENNLESEQLESIKPWLNYFLSIVKEQSVRALKYLEEEQFEDLLSPMQLIVWQFFVDNNSAFSPMEISKATNVAIPTVRQSLSKLLDLKKIKRIGAGPQTRYVMV